MKASYIITKNKFNASLNQETTEIKVSFKTGYYPLPGGGGGDLSNYYTKSETYSKIEINELLDAIEVTKTQLDVLISENKLEPNRLYKITGVESWCFSQHLIKAIYLKAITNNTLELEGVGEFYTPKYNKSDSNLGIWKGELLANGMISSASYNIGDKVIWGNLFWKNISGNIGTNAKEYYDEENDEYFFVKSQNFISETDWQLITPNDDESLYNIQFDVIKYDVENDYINYRADNLGNIYEISYSYLLDFFPNAGIRNFIPEFIYNMNSIALFQWGIGNTSNNIINESFVLNCNYNTSLFKSNAFVENSRIYDNNFLGVQIEGNNFKNSVLVGNYLKTFGGIINNRLDDSQILGNRYYFEIINNRLSNNSQIIYNKDNNIIVNNKYTIIKDNVLDNNCRISFNIFVEEGKEVDNNIKSIYGNELINNSTINNNTIKNGSRIFGHRLEYYSTINGNTLDTEANIYNNQVIQESKIDNNILTGHSRIYRNQLDDKSEITLCKLRIYPTTSHSSQIHSSRLFKGKIQNIDFGNIVNPEGTNPNDPAIVGNGLTDCIIENNSIIKDLTFTNSSGKYIQFVKMNGFSEFKNITVNDSIRNVDFINTIFNETSDYSKLIEGSGLQTNGFTKTYIDGILLQDKFDEKQDVLTEDNVGQFMDVKLSTKSTPTSGDTVLGRDSLTGKAVKIPTDQLGGSGNVDTSNLVPYTGATQDVNIASNYFKTSKGFDFTLDVNNYFRTLNYGNYTTYEFYSKDNSDDNLGNILFVINPEEGFLIAKTGGDGITNAFKVFQTGTYSSKPFISNEGFVKAGGTLNQALTANGGVFDLNTKADLVGGKVPSSQLPSYVDDVLEFENLASFPATGESGKIYIAIDTNLTYRWGGSSYVVMSSSLALGETSSTAYRGDRGQIAYEHSGLTGNPHGTKLEQLTDVSGDATSIVDTDVILKKETGGFWKKITWSNIKANLKTYFDSIYTTSSAVDSQITTAINSNKKSFTHNILVANWNLVSGKYEAVISNAGILANSFADVIPSNDHVDIVRNAQIYPSILISAGSVKVYSKFLPSGTISVTVNIN